MNCVNCASGSELEVTWAREVGLRRDGPERESEREERERETARESGR